ncbi:MAG: hypothetical protein EXS37_16340 [Opitutus sp.]|nr:hypothetical protein [Opitutus sp.]
MNLSPDWIPVLATHGFDCAHWRHLGAAKAEDRAIFDHAQQSRSIILTQDLDFGVILAQTNATSPSVVLLHAGTRVIAALRTCARELADGAILTLDDKRHRVRLLPLRAESLEPQFPTGRL